MRKPTRYPGVIQLEEGKFEIRATPINPTTGAKTDFKKIVKGTVKQAYAERERLIAKVVRTGEVDPERRRVEDYATWWLNMKLEKLKPSTRAGYAQILDDHIVPAFGTTYLDAITPVMAKDWIGTLSVLKGYTVRNIVAVMKSMFADAKADLSLPNDPFARVTSVMPKRHTWTEEDPNLLGALQLRRFTEIFQATEPNFYALTMFLTFTGVRWGEATALEWDDIRWKDGLIFIERAQWRGHIGPPKGKGRRTVPLQPELVEILEAHKALQRKVAPSVGKGGLVFPNSARRMQKNGALKKPMRRVFERLRDAATAEGFALPPRLTPHGLRRSFNNLLRQKASGIVARSVLGHSTESMTEHYSMVDAGEKQRAAAKVIKLIQPKAKA